MEWNLTFGLLIRQRKLHMTKPLENFKCNNNQMTTKREEELLKEKSNTARRTKWDINNKEVEAGIWEGNGLSKEERPGRDCQRSSATEVMDL